VGFSSLAAVSVLATGFRLPDQDAFATGRGEAFAATADNPSALYYNPAGIGQLRGHQVSGGVYGLNLRTTFESPTGAQFDNEADLHAIPQIFYVYGAEKLPLSFGLGVYSPYGLSSEWPETTGFRTLGLEARLTYLSVNPVVAWRITPGLMVAAGATFNLAEVELTQGLTPIPDNDFYRVEGSDWAPGFTLGGLWQVSEKFSIGLAYRSATTMDLEGESEVVVRSPVPPFLPGPLALTEDASARFPFPFNLVFGVSFRPTPRWNFEFNADYTDWSRLDTVTVEQAPLPPAYLVLNWRPSWYYEFGATRYLEKGWWVSLGYIFNENSVPDAFYSPLVSDLDRHFFSAGVGFEQDHFRLGLAYQFGYGPTRTVVGSQPSSAGETADGNYDFLSHAVILSAGWKF
jgi:long-chain fatty acid transport protein